MTEHKTADEYWQAYLTGTDDDLLRNRRLYRLVPSKPRCKFCNQPFGGLGGLLFRISGKGPSSLNPHLCNICEIEATKRPGGAHLEISMLFADVRGSTTLAEEMDTVAYSQLIRRFYSMAVDVLVESNAIIDKLVGDQVTGYYLPAFAGEDHVRVAIEDARRLLRRTDVGSSRGPWIPVGVGMHTGMAYFGAVSSKSGVSDITALGDNVNIAARLASAAVPGEVLVSEASYLAAGLALEDAEQREIELKGRSAPVRVRVLRE